LTSSLEGGEGSASRPGSTLPPGKTRYPLYRRLCGPQGRSGQVQNPRTVQPVGSRYTDYATRPSSEIYIFNFVYLSAGHTVYVREQGCENPWLFFKVKRGSASKRVGETLR